eukprot:687366_1
MVVSLNSLVHNQIPYSQTMVPYNQNHVHACGGKWQLECRTQCRIRIAGYRLAIALVFTKGIVQFFEDGEEITLYAIKSAGVHAFCCGYSLNLNISISCNSERYHTWHESEDVHLSRALYG